MYIGRPLGPYLRAGSIRRGSAMGRAVQLCSLVLALGILWYSAWLIWLAVDSFWSYGIFNPGAAVLPALLWLVAAVVAAPVRLYAEFLALRIVGLIVVVLFILGGVYLAFLAVILYWWAQYECPSGSLFPWFLPSLLCFGTSAVVSLKVRSGFRGWRR